MRKIKLDLQITEIEGWIGDERSPLVQHVRLYVPAKIKELSIESIVFRDLLNARGCEELAEIGKLIGVNSDLVFIPKQNLREFDSLVEGLIYSISILAFIPGGVEVFGTRYEVLQSEIKTKDS